MPYYKDIGIKKDVQYFSQKSVGYLFFHRFHEILLEWKFFPNVRQIQ